MKYMLTKKDAKEIAKLAALVTPIADFQNYLGPDGKLKSKIHGIVATVSGATLLEGKQKEVKGEAIDPDKGYVYDTGQVIVMNHKRRMIKLFKQGGWALVKDYMAKVDELLKNHPELGQKR